MIGRKAQFGLFKAFVKESYQSVASHLSSNLLLNEVSAVLDETQRVIKYSPQTRAALKNSTKDNLFSIGMMFGVLFAYDALLLATNSSQIEGEQSADLSFTENTAHYLTFTNLFQLVAVSFTLMQCAKNWLNAVSIANLASKENMDDQTPNDKAILDNTLSAQGQYLKAQIGMSLISAINQQPWAALPMLSLIDGQALLKANMHLNAETRNDLKTTFLVGIIFRSLIMLSDHLLEALPTTHEVIAPQTLIKPLVFMLIYQHALLSVQAIKKTDEFYQIFDLSKPVEWVQQGVFNIASILLNQLPKNKSSVNWVQIMQGAAKYQFIKTSAKLTLSFANNILNYLLQSASVTLFLHVYHNYLNDILEKKIKPVPYELMMIIGYALSGVGPKLNIMTELEAVGLDFLMSDQYGKVCVFFGGMLKNAEARPSYLHDAEEIIIEIPDKLFGIKICEFLQVPTEEERLDDEARKISKDPAYEATIKSPFEYPPDDAKKDEIEASEVKAFEEVTKPLSPAAIKKRHSGFFKSSILTPTCHESMYDHAKRFNNG